MAKQRNINIVYKVDTKQVQQAKEQVKQADVATNKLIDSTNKYSTASSAAYKKTSVSIQDLNTKLQFLRKEIENTDLRDTKRLDGLVSKYRTLNADVQKYNSLLNDQGKSTVSLTQQLGGLYNLVRGGILVGLVKETVGAIANMAILQGKIEGVRLAFNKLPGSTKILSDMRRATQGMSDDLFLMQKVLQAKNFGLPIQELGTLFEFATIRAQQTGIAVDYLIDSMVTGLGRGSIKILDNLQINVGELRKRVTAMGSTMSDVGAVTQVTVQLVKEEMSKMGGYVKTAETQIGGLSRAWKQFKQDVGVGEVTGNIAEFFAQALDNLRDFIKGGTEVKKELASISGQTKAQAFIQENQGKKNIQIYDEELKRLDQLAAKQKLKVMMLMEERKALGALNPKTEDQRQLINEQINTYALRSIATNEQIKLLQQSRKEVLISIDAEKEQVSTYEDLQKQLESLNEQFETATDRNDKKALANIGGKIIATKKLIEQLDSLREAQKNVDDDTADDGIVKKFTQDADKLIKEQEDFDKAWLESQKDIAKDYEKFYEDWRQSELAKDKEFLDEQVRLQKEAIQRKQRLQDEFVNFAINAGRDILLAATMSRQQDMSDLEAYYSNQIELAGNNERKKSQIELQRDRQAESFRLKQVEADKKATMIRIAIDTAANVVRSIYENGGVPLGLPFGAIAAGIGLTQSIAVSKLNYGKTRGASKFKDGVIDLQGPGTETSDSIPAFLSKRESVMTAQETKNSLNILQAIRAKKLDDNVFEKMVVNAPASVIDTSPIAKALGGMKSPDLVKQGDFIYEVKMKGKNTRRRIRSKSFSM